MRKTLFSCVCSTILLGGCATNSVTGRGQFVELPAVQVHADLGYAIAAGAKRLSVTESCQPLCRPQDERFAAQVERLGVQLEVAARNMSPDLFERIASFDIGVSQELGMASGASAGGRIVLGGDIALIEPAEDVTAFLLAREMAHVVARHDEENSGARILFSALSTLLPFTFVTRIFASTLGSGALVVSWGDKQRHEADEIALALLLRTGRSVESVARSLAGGYKKGQLPHSEWAARLQESAARVAIAAAASPQSASFDDPMRQESRQGIERIEACIRSRAEGKKQSEILAWRRECLRQAS